MLARIAIITICVATVLGIVITKTTVFQAAEGPSPTVSIEEEAAPAEITDVGRPLYAVKDVPDSTLDKSAESDQAGLVIPDCRLTVIDKQDVPSQRDGKILFIGAELGPGETLPADRTFIVRYGTEAKTFRRWREGDFVRAGQLLAHLDDRLARDEWEIKNARLSAAQADLQAALKTHEEAHNRYETQLQLQQTRGATSTEEVRTAKLTWEKAGCEAASRREALTLAERELNQAETLLNMHQIQSSISGVIKSIHKEPGEAVRTHETLFEIQSQDRLGIEGLANVEDLPRLRPGMHVEVEPCQLESPCQTLQGHTHDVTAVAVSRGLIYSASEDHTVRCWMEGREEHLLRHPAAVLALACGADASGSEQLVSGCSDGKARFWRDGTSRELKGKHDGPVSAVALSPDGRFCATGSWDREIRLWDTATGELRYRFPVGHRAAVTSLHFTPQAKLVSASKDNTLCVWALGEKGAKLESCYDRRSGDVTCPSVSADGRFALFDQGNVLRILSLADGKMHGAIQNASAAGSFSTFALFSPDGQLVLTTSEGRIQLWRSRGRHSEEVRELAAGAAGAPTCASFAPDGSFVVIGAKDHSLRVWHVPTISEIDKRFSAEVTLVEQDASSTARQVRFRAEMPNPAGKLLPGTAVTVVVRDASGK